MISDTFYHNTGRFLIYVSLEGGKLQLKLKGFAKGCALMLGLNLPSVLFEIIHKLNYFLPDCSFLAVMGFNHTTFWSLCQSLYHGATIAHR